MDDVRLQDDLAIVTVVCTGNIARSPFAMALLDAAGRRCLGRDAPLLVVSSGIHGLDGYPAVSEMQAAARDRGFDLGGHRATVTTRDEVLRCDLVLAMTEQHRAAILRLAPEAVPWTFTLRELARLVTAAQPVDGNLPPRVRIRAAVASAHRARSRVPSPRTTEDVTDPYGGTPSEYRRIVDEIEQLVEAIGPFLFGGGGEFRATS